VERDHAGPSNSYFAESTATIVAVEWFALLLAGGPRRQRPRLMNPQ
jgi:hypothetical protein